MAKSFFFSIVCFFILSEVNAQKNYNEVTLPELMKKLGEKDPNMIIVDVRTKGEYYDTASRFQQMNIGHIKGAINIPLQDYNEYSLI